MDTRARKQQKSVSAINTVFSMDLLREMIMDYVIHDGKDVAVSNVRSCRLVNNDWLNSTFRILLKSKEPLFRFRSSVVDRNRESVGKPLDGKFLRQFLKCGAKGSIMGGMIPPHSIKVAPVYSSQKCHALSSTLIICGASLVELNLDLTEFWNPVPLTSQTKLPKLRTFILRLHSFRHSSRLPHNLDTYFDFIQSVFTASEQLKSFKIESSKHPEVWTNELNKLQFPASTTELEFLGGYYLNAAMLEVLGKNKLPNLKTLKFCVNHPPFLEGLIISVLQNVRKTLMNLHVRTGLIDLEENTTFQFPLMEKLEKLTIVTRTLELQVSSSSIHRLLPVLKHLTLKQQPNSLAQKWIEKLRVDTLISLSVSVETDWHVLGEDLKMCDDADVDLTTMTTINNVYPNLRELDVVYNRGEELEGLLFIMAEMRQLHRLRILVREPCGIVDSDNWDTLLTGFRKEQLLRLKKSPELWEKLQGTSKPSIRNLTDLHTLELATLSYSGVPLISNYVFDFAFFKMPNLRKLALSRGFAATKKIIRQWRAAGRTIDSEFSKLVEDNEVSEKNDLLLCLN